MKPSTNVARLAKESRHAITADAYAEVDLAAAHLAGAWGALASGTLVRQRRRGAARACNWRRLISTPRARWWSRRTKAGRQSAPSQPSRLNHS